MKGYLHFPDNHKIHTFLYGKRGLIARRLIDRVGEGLFRAPPDPRPAGDDEPAPH